MVGGLLAQLLFPPVFWLTISPWVIYCLGPGQERGQRHSLFPTLSMSVGFPESIHTEFCLGGCVWYLLDPLKLCSLQVLLDSSHLYPSTGSSLVLRVGTLDSHRRLLLTLCPDFKEFKDRQAHQGGIW